jgi:hypothetical protein
MTDGRSDLLHLRGRRQHADSNGDGTFNLVGEVYRPADYNMAGSTGKSPTLPATAVTTWCIYGTAEPTSGANNGDGTYVVFNPYLPRSSYGMTGGW